jgi:hypothetical protein
MGRFIVDFACLEARCIVEADGGQHLDQVEYDRVRDDWLRSQGFVVLKFWNNDILMNTEAVLEQILRVCCERAPLPNPSPSRGGANGDISPSRVAANHPTSMEESNNAPLPWERGRGRGR